MVPALVAAGVAGANLLSGAMNTTAQQRARRAAEKGAAKGAEAIKSGYDSTAGARNDIDQGLQAYYDKMSRVYGDIDAVGKEYSDLLLGNGTTFTPDQFDYSKTVEDFYDPAWQVNNQAQMRALENSAANSGKLFSSGLQANMAGTTAANATNAYKEARNAFYTDKQLAQDQWYKRNQLAKDAASLNLQRAGLAGDYTNGYNDWLSNYVNAKVSNTSGAISDYNTALDNYAALMAQSGGRVSGPFSQFSNPSMPIV